MVENRPTKLRRNSGVMHMRMPILFVTLALACTGPLAADEPKKPADPPPGGYTSQQLIDALTKLGYEPTIYGRNKDKCWISLSRGTYKTTVNFEVTSDLTTIWFDCPLNTIAFPAQAPNKAMRVLLEENEKIDPAHFTYDTVEKRFHLYHGQANRDWNPKKLRQKIETFDDLLRKEEPIWRIDNFLRLPPVAEDLVAPERAAWQGTWKLIEGSQAGVVTPPEQLAKANVTVTISGNKLSALQDGKKLEWTFFLDPNHQPKAADFVLTTSDRVEAGIYKIEGDKLTIHLSAIGVERPANFAVPEGDKRSILVLQRQNP
jgi:uncharacterized protein (TIGR03067 family)